jgi:flagellar assembly protein FliH
MAKSVFRPTEINKKDEKVLLKLSHTFVEESIEEIPEEIPQYEGPTADDLRREAEAFKTEWEEEKQRMFDEASKEAEKIVKKAEQAAFEEIKRKTNEAAVLKKKAEEESERIIKEAENKSFEIIQAAEMEKDQHKADAYKQGFESGREAGFDEGKREVDRLVDRMRIILEKTMDKRQSILDETEQQIVELVLLISRKVIKVISESQRNVVMSNIVQALRKVKGRGDVVIRVNIADLELTSEHTKEFIEAVENIKNITFAEDSSVDRGGCIIETDFGAIDARISSQLSELEQKILEISPIKNVSKANAINLD